MDSLMIKHAYKNATRNKLRLISIIISLSIIFIFSYLFFSVDFIVINSEYRKSIDKNNGFDFYTTVDSSNNDRFYSINSIKNKIDDNNDLFLNISSYINLPIYFQGDKPSNIFLYTSDLYNFNSMYNSNITSLAFDEVIISKKLKEDNDIKDEIYLNLNNTNCKFRVVGVYDNGFFSSYSVFINRDHIDKYFNLPIINLSDIVNVSYFKVKKGVDLEYIKEKLSNDFDFISCSDKDQIILKSKTRISSLKIVFMFILIVIVVVLNSLLKRIFQDKEKEYLTLKSLGGERVYFISIIILEMLIYFLISFIIGTVFYQFISYILGNIIYSKSGFYFDVFPLFKGVLIVFIIKTILIYLNFLWFKRLSYQKKNKVSLLKLTIKCIIYIILFLISNLFEDKYKGFLSLIIIVLFSFYSIRIILIILSKIFKNNFVFSIFNLKIMALNKTYFNSLKIFIICLISISSILIVRGHIISSSSKIFDMFKYDYFIYNIHNYDNEFIDMLDKNTDSYLEIGYFRNVKFTSLNYNVDVAITTDGTNYDTYFDVYIDTNTLNKLASKDKYVVLNKNLKTQYNLAVDDIVTVMINDKEENVKIAGFVDYGLVNQCIFSMSVSPKIDSVLLINPHNDFFNEISRYTDKMFILMNTNSYIHGFFDSAIVMTNFISFMCIIIILLLFIVIINNSLLFFEEMKETYSKIRILGLSSNEFIKLIILEILVVFLVIIPIIIIFMNPIVKNSCYVLILFNNYYEINMRIIDVVFGISIGAIAYILSQVMFIKKIRELDLTLTIKTF